MNKLTGKISFQALGQRRQQGVTLVELMVAMVISLIVLAGVGNIFIAGKRAYLAQEGLSRVQENGRFALAILSRDINLAGYHEPGQAAPAPIKATNGTGTASDTLTIRYKSPPLGATPPFGTMSCANTFVAEGDVVTNDYFIQLNGQGIPGLFCDDDMDNLPPPIELIEGIDNMQLLFGIDTNADGFANQYVTADAVPAFANVVTIRLALLTRGSRDGGATLNKTYPVLGQNLGPFVDVNGNIDGIPRRVFTTTILIRNAT